MMFKRVTQITLALILLILAATSQVHSAIHQANGTNVTIQRGYFASLKINVTVQAYKS